MGPLAGLRIIEVTGIGPGPLCGTLLADMGADVLKVDRADAIGGDALPPPTDLLARGRRSAAIDLKHPDGAATLLRLVERADGLFEGFRPGVMERLGVGPDECMSRNPALVYGRMTGWGQDGPLAHTAGHDIDYIALAGALWSFGRRDEPPVPPLNLVGDFGGGGAYLAFGMVCALWETARSGKGQVVDAAVVDGSSLNMAMFHSMRAAGVWRDERGANLIDTGAHFYEVYTTSDGRYFAVGAIEPKFYAELLDRLGLDAADLPDQYDRDRWPEMKERFAAVFATRTRDEWTAIFDDTDACGAPVLALHEAHEHPHNAARDAFIEIDGVRHPAPAPRFSRTRTGVPDAAHAPGADTDVALADWGFSPSELERLRAEGAVVQT